MSESFKSHIEISLANPNLQTALDGNAERRLKARLQAYSTLPEDLQVMRQRAHAVRAGVIANLEALLGQFISQAEGHGMIVHRAADAAEAVKIVLDLAHQNNARLVAKSKTMVGEEIAINEALQGAGIEAIETDLGEYIVQLRGERPAHIITPAVHLRRGDVARTFEEKLGVPYNEDIPAMTAIAREKMRQIFLQADIGISGVNFGVAESGTLCLITNEGNGRMVTTLPRLHIALMGIERLVPRLEDLALMLALLPRSATGQKLTVYTSLIHGPRRPEDPDGPEQRHVILVDNGRRALLGSPLEEALLCIRCGACLNACPVFREIGGHAYVGAHGQATAYPGPIGSVLSPGLFGGSEFGALARASSLCGACKDACPVDIDLPRMLLRVRAGLTPESLQLRKAPAPVQTSTPSPTPRPSNVPTALGLGLRVYAWAARSPRRFTAAQRLAGWSGRLLGGGSAWLRLPAFTGWGLSRDFPQPASTAFRQRLQQRQQNLPLKNDQFAGSDSLAAMQTLENASTDVDQSSPPVDEAPIIEPLIDDEQSRNWLAKRFAEELKALGGSFTACQSVQLCDRLLGFLQERQITRLQAWEPGHLPPGLLEYLRSSGIQISHSPDPDLRAGLTGALAGIAETGTLALSGGPGQPLTASLLPELHIAVLNAADIVESLAQAFSGAQADKNSLRQEILSASTAVLVSGPSRTADIEMTLTIGVHGPKEVHVFCIE